MKIYLISLPTLVDRRIRMQQRLSRAGWWHKTVVIDAVDRNSELVKWKAREGRDKKATLGEYACFMSHLKALRTFLCSKDQEAIIMEDDAMLPTDFDTRLNKLLPRFREHNLVLFWALTWGGRGKNGYDYDRIQTPSTDPDFCPIITEGFGTWGTACYWITRKHAERVVEALDRPIYNISEHYITSELIPRLSQGVFLRDPLVMEECISSTLRGMDVVDQIREIGQHYNPERFLEHEEEFLRKIWGMK